MTAKTQIETESYQSPAPVFAGEDAPYDVIGQAQTAAKAMAIYANYFAGPGNSLPARAVKAVPDVRGEGPVDGWVPLFDDAA